MEKVMSRKLIPISTIMTLMSTSVMADVPNVAADIAPIHSLVSKVMDGVGEPKLVIQSGASPHGYRLRPSEAKALQDANLIFWMGEELTPWLDGAIDTLASNASVTSLLDQEGVVLHEFREGALFEAHDHSAHDDHDDHETTMIMTTTTIMTTTMTMMITTITKIMTTTMITMTTTIMTTTRS